MTIRVWKPCRLVAALQDVYRAPTSGHNLRNCELSSEKSRSCGGDEGSRLRDCITWPSLIQHADMPEEEEAKQIEEAIRIHGEVTGARPTGWYTGRWSVNTRRLLTRAGGFVNDSDSFADELPYWTEVEGRDHLIVPYTLVNNDIRYVNTYGYQSPTFSSYLIQAFEFLRREGAQSPKMMSVGLHTRLVGHPGHAADLERFLDHVLSVDDVWVTRRIDIAHHWGTVHPPLQRP